ncbi:Hypothetical predicted protein [Mytilus galloprovincialis]|uniref:Integrase catalytic domain-containing protein n=1 Tax=Mytilus galloprovincialis TaxID=29158 RepID=A0A8B6E163_MYTGA|nr:Hypothetical predicted protein [Mytilus galloprovincialis]
MVVPVISRKRGVYLNLTEPTMAAMSVNTKMLNVLQKLNLQQAFPNFEREKITPDIVCRLSTHEMEILGVSSGIDGFSRLITFLKCTGNNTSRTVLDCFFSGVAKYGIPNKVRSDKGLEYVSVANYILIQKGPNTMVTGKSTHNQRIERLWRDVYEGVLSYFYNLFYFKENEGYLDPLKLTNLAALHFVFMDEINRKLQFWAEAWAGHRLRTVNSSPLSLWTSGQLQNARQELSEGKGKQYGAGL